MDGIRVLLVEDDPVIALITEKLLVDCGYEVAGLAESGDQAVQKAGEIRPDVVLMDIMLKTEMDGVAASEEIRNKFGSPVIFLTSNSDEATLQRAKITGPYGYLIKPVNKVDLRIAIEITLHKHKLELERNALIETLEKTLREVKTLRGLLPICSSCKKIRDDSGYWNHVEIYVKKYSDADFTHGICPDCVQQLYGEYLTKKKPVPESL